MEFATMERARNLAIALLVAAGLVIPAAGVAYAADGTDADGAPEANDRPNGLFSGDVDDANLPKKTESVYVFATADGSVKNTVVSSWLKNPQHADTLQDVSSLADIQNTDGQETFTNDAGNLVWNAEGNDIYYQGTTDKEAPVSIRVTYWLDGAEIAPADLRGKSGHVKIRFDYANHASTTEYVAGAARTVYTPFACITGMVLKNDVFSNVTARNARVMDDADRTLVGGVVFPGMQANLDVDDNTADFPEYLEVEADVVDFTMGTTATLVSSDLLNSINTDKLDTGDLGDSLNALSDAMGQLANGTGELRDGMQQLGEGAHALDGGIAALQAGVSGDGTSANPGLAAGLQALSGGLHSVNYGDGNDASGLADAASLLDAVDLPDTSTLAAAISEAQGAAGQSAKAAETAAAAATGAQGQAQTAADAVDEAISQLDPAEDAAAIESLEKAKAALASEDAGAIALAGSAATAAGGAQRASQALANSLEKASIPDTGDLGAKLGALKGGLKAASEALAAMETQVDEVLVPGAQQLAGGLDALKEGSVALATGADAAAEGTGQLASGVVQLNDEGIQKLLNAYHDDVEGLTDRLKATVRAGKDYTTFSGKSDAMRGSVRFIYETEAIE